MGPVGMAGSPGREVGPPRRCRTATPPFCPSSGGGRGATWSQGRATARCRWEKRPRRFMAVTLSMDPELFIFDFHSKGSAISLQLKSSGKGKREGAFSVLCSPGRTCLRDLGGGSIARLSLNTRKRGDSEASQCLEQVPETRRGWNVPGMRDSRFLLHVLGPYERLHVGGCSQSSERACGLHVPLDSAQCPFRPSERSTREEDSLLAQACRAGAKSNRFERRLSLPAPRFF